MLPNQTSLTSMNCADLRTFDSPEQNACAALLAFVSLLWCTEALPLFVTSMLVPLLTVLLRVLVDTSDPEHPHRMTPKQAAPRIFHAMFSQAGPRPQSCLHLSCSCAGLRSGWLLLLPQAVSRDMYSRGSHGRERDRGLTGPSSSCIVLAAVSAG